MESGLPYMAGRDAERDQLFAAARAAAAGHGSAVLLQAPVGLGKTTLLDHLAAECARLGMRVLRGTAEELEQELPFAAISTCVADTRTIAADPDLAHVAALLRGEGALTHSATAANHELALTEAILDLTDRWLSRGPLALLLDEAQWTDRASAVVLHRLARTIEQTPLLLVIAARVVAQGEALDGLERSLVGRGATVLTLPPLTPEQTRALVEHRLGAIPSPALLAMLDAAGGNPTYLGAILADAVKDGTVVVADGRADLAAGARRDGVPRPLAEIAAHELELIPRRYREAVQTAAVLGATVDVGQLAAVLDTPVMDLADVISDAIRAGMLVETEQTLRFRQNLTRQALAQSLPAAVRAALHQRAGRVLEQQHAPVEQVAAHLLASGRLEGDDIAWIEANADVLLVRAAEPTVRLLRQALASVTGQAADLTARLRRHLVRALLWAGDPVQAETQAREALAGDVPADSACRTELRWLLTQACYRQGHLQDTIDTVAAALADPDTTVGQAGRLRGTAAVCLLLLGRYDEGMAWADRSVADGESAADDAAIGIGSMAKAFALSRDDLTESLTLVDRAIGCLGPGIQPDLQVDPYTLKAFCLIELDRLAEADEASATAVRVNQRSGGMYLTSAYVARAHLRFLQGRWDDARAECRTGLDGPDPLGHASRLWAFDALIGVHRGEPGAGLDVPAIPVAPEDDGGNRVLVQWAQALGEEALGGYDKAFELLHPAWVQAGGVWGQRLIYRITADLVRTLVALGRDGELAELVEALRELVDSQPVPSLRGCLALCEGTRSGDPAPLAEAVVWFRRAGWPLYEGYAHEAVAVAHANNGATADARAALRRALAVYAEVDADWDVGRAKARARQAGLRTGVRGTRNRPKHGWAALTDTELRVAEQVAAGLSNPDIAAQMFLSRRTVQSHVSSILAKLGLTSRVELAVAVHSAADRTHPVTEQPGG
ncbi:helix-turn-helix transcriptional regulator [Catellatospora tritici]|uniref:helix-turn-helix transcriptional regulator n=1 Tax=Catellatospora tritici TaxID=2851566 RepID=UPI001C2DD28F|nr:AAA family ATPase [Catellatospora tritici]MBV1854748.1 AAA family ATPase [Catellatospora tritici]